MQRPPYDTDATDARSREKADIERQLELRRAQKKKKKRPARMKMSAETRRLYRIKRRFSPVILLIPVIVIALIFGYIFFDNNRIVLDTFTFSMPTLPRQLEGSTILHLSDIHEADLGENAEKITKLLNGKKPSFTVVTGGLTDENGDAAGFLELCKLMQSLKVPVYYIVGDNDPLYYDYLPDGTYGMTQLHKDAQALGAVYLELPVPLYEGDTSLWLTPASALLLDTSYAQASLDALENTYLESSVEVARTGHSLSALLENIRVQRENTTAFGEVAAKRTHNDLTIMLSHLPAMPAAMQSESNSQIFGMADLILSGANHGGILHISGLGAFMVKNDRLPRDGLFVADELVSGLSDTTGQWQYISPGVGTGSSSFFSLRVFSPPTATLITLTKKVA